MLIGLLVAVQMVLSDWWLLRFRAGPLEAALRRWVAGTGLGFGPPVDLVRRRAEDDGGGAR